jgi:organic radical activating enzyme
MQIEFDGQRDVAKQKTTLRNSCCCNLESDRQLDSLESSADLASDVKQSMQLGQVNPRCYRCHNSEKQTGTSERTMALLSMPPTLLETFVNTLQVPEFTIRIKFSNLCNLACRSCSPTFSSRYAQTHQLTVPVELTKDIGSAPDNWNFITSSIVKYLSIYQTINITLLGGESTIQPGAIKLLQWIKEQDLCKRVCLDITTNMTVANTSVIDKLSLFKKIHISASIDSVGKNFEYVRWPAQFQTVVDNFNTTVIDLVKQHHEITVQPLLNLNNIFYIVDIVNWWHDWFTSNNINSISIDPVMMFRPHHMTVQNLPVQYRAELVGCLRSALEHPMFQHSQPRLKDYLQGVLEFAQTSNTVYDQFELFLFDTARHDLANKTKMQIGNKKFHQLLSDKHKDLLDQFYHQLDSSVLPTDQQKIYRNLPL